MRRKHHSYRSWIRPASPSGQRAALSLLDQPTSDRRSLADRLPGIDGASTPGSVFADLPFSQADRGPVRGRICLHSWTAVV
jgi:hypothetical protein